MWHTYVSKRVHSDGWIDWTDTEDSTWQKLISRQKDTIQGRACNLFHEWCLLIDFPDDRIPLHREVNTTLLAFSDWTIVPVPAIISDIEFHTLLSERKFPWACFIRIPEELDYIEEPDIFHEFFGHLPLLVSREYWEFLEKFGTFFIQSPKKYQKLLCRIFWFTIEFWLIRENDSMKIYWAGILSSHGETLRSLKNNMVEHVPFDLLTIARTPYRYDVMQTKYFFIESFDELFHMFEANSFPHILESALELGDIIN